MASPRHTPAQIRKNSDLLREFHEAGLKSLEKRSGRAKYADDEARKEAEAAGMHVLKLLDARRFADPENGYTPGQLVQLLADFEKYRFSFGTSAVARLLSVRPGAERKRLQRESLEEGWSLAQLRAAIAREYGPRGAGGRRRRVPAERADVLVQLEQLCTSWGRWRDALGRDPGDGGDAPGRSLPKSVLKRISRAGEAIAELHGAVERSLEKENPGRQKRGSVPPRPRT
jgi:hypothetical protein